MGTFQSFRKAYGALKDSTMVGLAKVNSEYKELDIAIVKATSHVEYPPKERHVRKIFYATSAHQPRADVAYCIRKLSKRLSKTRSWIVAIKTLIVIHRILREGDPTFKEDLVNYSRRGHFLQISNFKDDSSPLAWDCSAWVRTYALFLEERLESFRILRYDIESERLTKSSPALTKAHSRTRMLASGELLEQLPALQQLLYRLIGCQPEGSAFSNYLIQYALALVLKESFKIYCALNDGIINLVEMFFDMPRYDAVQALHIYKRAGQQAEDLADFYEYCKGLDLARNFQFPTLRQPPPSFLATMEEYIKEAPEAGSVHKRLLYQEDDQSPKKEETEPEEPQAIEKQGEEVKEEEPGDKEETQPKEEEAEPPPLISTDDLLGLNEINPKALELEESNALALAIVPPGGNNSSNLALTDISGTSGWELALVTTPSNHTSQAPDRKMAGGFDKLLLDSLYEDENARRQLQLQNAGYGYGGMAIHNQFDHYNQYDPFAMSNNIAPPSNVQMALMNQQQQQQQMVFQQQQQQMMFQQQQQHNMMMVPYQHSNSQYPQQMQVMGSSNPFVDPLPIPSYPYSSMHHQHQGNHNLI
ncbi:putative clathrin assembly protein At5g57200 [Gastrolobium bilobum]|uniref:putative clathrin assembly protein At5g57200 n=1 Tax=Gastrolobium bilobum TaxID=150636 RepID=UPI002AAFF5E6|nr:putative clathrin assembly protein At5g57200 [Gastrolobium bilobum]